MQGGGAAGGLCRRFALLGCFLLSVLHTEPAVESNAVLIGYIDNARSLVVNLNLLLSVAAALVGSMYHDFVNQIIQNFRRKLLRIGVFTKG